MQIAKSKKLAPQAVRTALNYAWLLLSCESPKKAIAVLSPYVNNSHDSSLTHLIALVLGQSYLALGKPEQALEHLEHATRLSKAIGDFEQHLDAAAAFADALEQIGRFDEAIQWLQSVESMEKDPKLWSVLMTQLLRVQMKADSPDSQATYNRIQRFATKHELNSSLADLHLAVGEHLWLGERFQAPLTSSIRLSLPRRIASRGDEQRRSRRRCKPIRGR
jgi:predicted negative regulator of RcsB-dependent stress response